MGKREAAKREAMEKRKREAKEKRKREAAKQMEKREKNMEKMTPLPPADLVGNLIAIAAFLRKHFGISLGVGATLTKLINRRLIITDAEDVVRFQESFKQSWDTDFRAPICFDNLSNRFSGTTDPILRERIQKYLDSTKKTKFFDADMEVPPEGMNERFYLLYPPELNEKNCENPVIAAQPKLMKYAPNLEKLAIAAVFFHNGLTGSCLTFHKVVKSNIYFDLYGFLLYFITLEAWDRDRGSLVICKSRVDCHLDHLDCPTFNGESRIKTAYVDSFQVSHLKEKLLNRAVGLR